MRRILLLLVMVIAAGVLAPVLAVLAQSSTPTSATVSGSSATGSTNKKPTASSTDDNIIDEMIAILKETKSEETFIVTAMALASMGPEAKRALPQLIRNAERLKLFEDLFDSSASKGDREIAQRVAESIVMLAAGQPMGYLNTRSAVPCANGSYDNPPAAGSWSQPTAAPSAAPPYPTSTGSCLVAPPPVLTPGNVRTPAAPSATPLPAGKNTSPKGSPSQTPVAPPPSSTR